MKKAISILIGLGVVFLIVKFLVGSTTCAITFSGGEVIERGPCETTLWGVSIRHPYTWPEMPVLIAAAAGLVVVIDLWSTWARS